MLFHLYFSPFFPNLLLYLLISLIYNLKLRSLVLIDCFTLAVLYTLRIISGAAAVNLVPSFWLLSFSIFIFLSLAFVKRYSELKKYVQFRKVLKSYNPKTLFYLIFASYFFVIIAHFYYTLQDEIYGLYGLGGVLSNVLVIMVLTKFLIAGLKQHTFEDPTNYLFRDVVSITSILLYVGIFASITYF